MNKRIDLFILCIRLIAISFFVSINSFAITSFKNLTSEESVQERADIFNKRNNPGFRIQIGDIKAMNKMHGIGNVNLAIESFEQNIIKSLEALNNKFTSLDIKISKTDFKGYYITCNPMPKCLNQLTSFSASIDKQIKINKKSGLALQVAFAKNYSESYIFARTLQNYPEYDGQNPPLAKFLARKIRDLIAGNKINIEELKHYISVSRRSGTEKIPLKYKQIINLLDTLEIPFSTANNLDLELTKALDDKSVHHQLDNKIIVNHAQSGDDLYIVVKDNSGETIKVIGADARGLGVLNMTARYEAFFDKLKVGKIETVNDIFNVSLAGIKQADRQMFESMELYRQIIKDELEKVKAPHTKDKIVIATEKAHRRYMQEAEKKYYIMSMRAAAIDSCETNDCLNKMTVKHNRLKEEEVAVRKKRHKPKLCRKALLREINKLR